MTYATAKLSLVTSTIEGQGPQFWTLINSDSIATMLGASYITDATKLGMRVGDLVFLSSGTFNTAVYPASGAATADVGEGNDFTDTPPVRAVVQVGSISSGSATLTDKLQVGGAATAYVGFFGATPIVKPVGAAQAAVTDASGGAAAPTNGILTLTGTYNSTILANAIATLAAQGNAMQTALVNLGLMKGSA